jgi:uncharacterized protein (TIGR03435 family)
MLLRTLVSLSMVMLIVPTLVAQSPANAGKRVAFEVASVKPNPLRAGIRGHDFPGDRFEAKNVPLRDLIMVAYGAQGQALPESQMTGGPSWIDSDRFDISAKVGSADHNSVAEKQLMLRTLLAERFKLAVHIETKDLLIYELVLARKDGKFGAQLRHAEVDCEALRATQPGRRERCVLYALPSGQLMFRGQTMNAVANVLTMLIGRVVKDRTGLTGGFDADAQFNPEGLPGMTQGPSADRQMNDIPSLDTAIQEQLGLKLQSARGPVELLVIDHVEHPTAN